MSSQRPARLAVLRRRRRRAPAAARSSRATSSRTTALEALALGGARGRDSRASRAPPAGCRATPGCLRSGRAAAGRAATACSKSRGDVVEHQHEAAELRGARRARPDRAPAPAAPAAAGRRGVPVTNCADGLAAPRAGAAAASRAHARSARGRRRRRSSGRARSARRRRPSPACATARGTAPGRGRCRAGSAVEVADDDALRQLGHQRREPVALLLDPAARLGDLSRRCRRAAARAGAAAR